MRIASEEPRSLDVHAACLALERPLDVLSGLIDVARNHAHPTEDLRALLERVARQAAAVHEMAQHALTAGAPIAAPPTTSAGEPADAPPPARAPSAEQSHGHVGQFEGQSALHALTKREKQVLTLVANGLASKEIAHRLGITSATVRSHVQNILTKLGVCNRSQAAALLTDRLPSATRARLRSVRRAPDVPLQVDAAPSDVAPPARARLTRREAQVLQCLAAGLGRSEIAERLYVSPHTARTHVQRVLSKLGVHSVLGAMAVARAAGVAPAW
jgi:DNA-binding NarL/FixJ family response regulator